jgi:CubicO group peptidase (beta-lactamase class C family)
MFKKLLTLIAIIGGMITVFIASADENNLPDDHRTKNNAKIEHRNKAKQLWRTDGSSENFNASNFAQLTSTPLDSFIVTFMDSFHIPGLSACVIKDGNIFWEGAYGIANFAQSRKVNNSTLFLIMSISKTITSTALMQLYEDGLFGLDDNINEYLPFNVIHPLFPDSVITFRMLMTHTSGITSNYTGLGHLFVDNGDSPVPLNSFLSDYLIPGGAYYRDANFNLNCPGTKYDYCNIAVALIGYLVELISGTSFEQYCQEHIFKPLSMNETSWFLANLNKNNIAMPYHWTGSRYDQIGHWGWPFYPASHVRTSAPQLARFLIAFMQKGQIDSVQILDTSTVEMMNTVQYAGEIHPRPGVNRYIGLLWWKENLGDRWLWGHDGGGELGATTKMFFCPEENTGVIVLTNGEIRLETIAHVLFEFASTSPYVLYSNHFVDDSQGNNNGIADGGEAISLILNLANLGNDANNISVTLSSSDPDVQFVQSTNNFGDVSRNEFASNQINPFTFTVDPSSGAHLSTFYLNITADGGYARTDSLELIIGSPTVLLVDDDAGRSYETHFTKHILYPEMWEAGWPNCPSLEYLKKFKAVIWFTGNDQKFTLTKVDQDTIAAFLNDGGRLLITGQDIGFDLVEDGSASDSVFFANYLHANYVSNQTNDKLVAGISGDPVTNGLTAYFFGNYGGAGNQESPDIIEPIPPAETILRYAPSLMGAGLRYQDDSTGARLIYLAFGFEGIAGPTEKSAKQLLDKAIAWLKDELPAAVDNRISEPTLPKIYALKQNYPNPFNPTTTITFNLPKSGYVEITVYNMLGQSICKLLAEEYVAGIHSVIWDGRDDLGIEVSSGIYFYSIQADDFSASRKMILIR